MQELDIATVAERSGLPASTLRYYEEQGLIRLHRPQKCDGSSTITCSNAWL